MLILTFLTHCVPCLLQHEKLQSAPGSRVGTPAYLAPEVILTTKGKTYDGKVAHPPSNAFEHTQSNTVHVHLIYCLLSRSALIQLPTSLQ